MNSRAKQSARRASGSIMVVVGLAFGLAVTGCGVSGPPADPGRPRPAQTSVPLGTGDPRAREAVAAYENFVAATIYMQKDPVAEQTAYPEAGDFTRFSFDPVQAEYQAAITALSQGGDEFRGTPPASRLSVTAIDLDASPPTVTLWECRTGLEGWQPYDTETDKPSAEPSPDAVNPSGSTIAVVFERQRWGVKTITQDPARTCS